MNFGKSFRYAFGKFVFEFYKNRRDDDVIVTSFKFSPNNCSYLKVKQCYSRFNFHVLDYCQCLRMRDDIPIPECIINKLNYGVSHQLPVIANPNSIHSL